MKEKANPWLPWKDTIKLPPIPEKGNVLVIIPTAGKKTDMLERCLSSLKLAAVGEIIHVLIIVSPGELEDKERIENLFGKDAKIVLLEGPFNYCRSINQGLSFRDEEDKYVLFLNDDVTFTNKGDLHQLKETLVEERWACIGPFINYNPNVHDPTWPKEKSSLGAVPKTSGAVRTNLPVSGSCSLWNLKWLDMIGKLDEGFGKGWGMDEADLSIRALRLGARYGRQDKVSINHLMHATFGEEATRYTSPAHMLSLNYFRKKYGNEIEEWGKSYHWLPLPGIQVIILPCENLEKFRDCLNKTEIDLDGFRWILSVGCDARNKKAYKIAKNHCKNTSADECIIKEFKDIESQNKKILKEMLISKDSLKDQYPAIYLIDPNRNTSDSLIKDLLWKIRDSGDLAGKIGEEKTISEEMFPNIKFRKFKGKKISCGNDSIFHISLLTGSQNEQIS